MKRKGWKRLILGIVLILLAVVAVPVAIVVPILGAMGEVPQFVVPGTHRVEVEEAGRYYLWNDHQTLLDGRSYSQPEALPGGIEIRIENDAGEELSLRGDTSISSNVGATSRRSIGHVEVARPGALSIEVAGDFDERVFSFSEFDFGAMFAKVFGALALAGVGFLLGLGITIWGIVKVVKSPSAPSPATAA